MGKSAKDFMTSKEILALAQKPIPIITDKDTLEKYKNFSLHFAMNASIEVTKKGRLYSCWIGGEDGPESYMIVTYSDDSGESWKGIQFIVDPHSDDIPHSLNTHVGCLWCDPKGRLWLFYQQSLGMWDGKGCCFAMVCNNPDDENPTWEKPYPITPGSIIKKPIVLSNGNWLLPVSIWERWHITPPFTDIHKEYDSIRGSNAFVSKDEGKTWELAGGLIFKDSCYNEHSLVELSNGEIMMASRCMGSIKKSFSKDEGKTWSEEELYFPHATGWSSMATFRKLSSGNLLLIKHGFPFEEVTWPRDRLAAYLSKDGGKTWLGGLMLDERDSVSYPDICQTADGTIYVQYDYNRATDAQILFARFTEEDVLKGEGVSKDFALRKKITSNLGIKGTAYTLFENVPDGFESGDGTKENPFIISNADDFNCLAKLVYHGNTFEDKFFLQTANVDFKEKEILPVGAFNRKFSGSYDGNGYTLKNFTISAYHITDRAPFANVSGATIKNVSVSNSKIRGRNNVGGIIGRVSESEKPTTIENCFTADSVSLIAFQNIGGIVGNCESETKISNCTNKANVTVPRTTDGKTILAGGILGASNENVKIENCVNHGNLTANYAIQVQMGGIVGGETALSVLNCKNHGNLLLNMAVESAYLSGISGKKIRTENCENSGEIKYNNAENISIN